MESKKIHISFLKRKPTCLECLSIPYISVNNKHSIHIKCLCGKDKHMDIKQYIDQIDSNSLKRFCTEHPNTIAVAYCSECKKWKCIECANEHFRSVEISHHPLIQNDFVIPECSFHNKAKEYYCEQLKDYLCQDCINNIKTSYDYIHLPSFAARLDIRRLKQRIKEGEKYLEEYYTKVKDNYLQRFEKEYEESIEANRSILQLFTLFVNNYTPNRINNYNLLKNISNIHLQFLKYDEKSDLLEFFQNNNVIKAERFDFNSIQSIKTLEYNEASINSLVVLRDGRLASCSRAPAINIYDPKEDFRCDLTIQGHNTCIVSLCVLDDGELVSCSGNYENKIKIWKITNNLYRCLATLDDHKDQINKVISLPANRMASCSNDKKIKIWKTKTPYQCIQTLDKKNDMVWSITLMIDNKTLVAGTEDSTLFVWNINTYNMMKSIGDVYCCLWNSLIGIDCNRVAVGGEKVLKIVNIVTSQIEKIVQDNSFAEISSLLILRDGNLMFGDTHGIIYYYDFANNVKKKEKCHTSYINCLLYINENEIASCSDDSLIKIWE